MLLLLLLSLLTNLLPAAPLPAAHLLAPHSPQTNTTATVNVTADTTPSRLTVITDYLTSTLLRRCGGRRGTKCGGSTNTSPPPPPPPIRIVQTLYLGGLNTSHYTGIYRVVAEAGWGIAIRIYDTNSGGFEGSVERFASSASKTCNANECGIKVYFSATIAHYNSHSAEYLSPSRFCDGFSRAKKRLATGVTIPHDPCKSGVYRNGTNVRVLTTVVEEEEKDQGCFPSNTLVETKEHGPTRMEKLQVGDHVLGPTGYSEVLFFAVKLPTVSAKCTAITTETGSTLVISRSHGIFTRDRAAVTVSKLRVGDSLLNAGTITHLETQPCRGLVSPITQAGSIVVGDFVTSDYGPLAQALGHTTAHLIMWPIRILRAAFPAMELWHAPDFAGKDLRFIYLHLFMS